ncbi:MAG: hypothetical protein DSY89_10890 [Deltaproteobacteria bacterium]|nr:MAG: hypothetical protein DSY89_10890 [Deltaproteobacteria bacterium]
METTYRVVFSGSLRPGNDPGETSQKLVADFGLATAQAEKLVTSGQRVIVKKGIDRKTGEILCQRLEQAGLNVDLLPQPADTPDKSAPVTPPPRAPAEPEPAVSPSAPRETGADPAASKTAPISESSPNPYAAPVADLDRPDEHPAHFGEPRKVSAGRGWKWLTDAYGLFKEHPWIWMGMVALTYLLLTLSNLIPLVGPFIGYFLFPVFFGGLMLGARAQYQGDTLRFDYLFAGFSRGRNQLLLLGLLYTLGFIACIIPMALFFGVSFFSGKITPDVISGGNIFMMLISVLATLALTIPLYMAAWFSSPLIVVNEYSAWPAMKLSFQACRKNIWPFTVYGLVLLLVFMVFTAILGIIMALVVPLMVGQNSMFPAMFILPLVMMIPILPAVTITTLSIYTGYRDLFYS